MGGIINVPGTLNDNEKQSGLRYMDSNCGGLFIQALMIKQTTSPPILLVYTSSLHPSDSSTSLDTEVITESCMILGSHSQNHWRTVTWTKNQPSQILRLTKIDQKAGGIMRRLIMYVGYMCRLILRQNITRVGFKWEYCQWSHERCIPDLCSVFIPRSSYILIYRWTWISD